MPISTKPNAAWKASEAGFGGICVDLADDAVVPGADGMLEQVGIEPTRAAASAGRWRDHDPVDIHKARIAGAEPDEIGAVVSRVLIEGEQEGVHVAYPSCEERLADQVFEPFRLQPGQLLRVRVVEREKGLSERLVPQHVGDINRSWLCIIHRSWRPMGDYASLISKAGRVLKRKKIRGPIRKDRARV